jgi:hypothetical protein
MVFGQWSLVVGRWSLVVRDFVVLGKRPWFFVFPSIVLRPWSFATARRWGKMRIGFRQKAADPIGEKPQSPKAVLRWTADDGPRTINEGLRTKD